MSKRSDFKISMPYVAYKTRPRLRTLQGNIHHHHILTKQSDLRCAEIRDSCKKKNLLQFEDAAFCSTTDPERALEDVLKFMYHSKQKHNFMHNTLFLKK